MKWDGATCDSVSLPREEREKREEEGTTEKEEVKKEKVGGTKPL